MTSFAAVISPLLLLLRRLGIVLLFFTFCRVLFWIFNTAQLKSSGLSEWFGGLVFDITTICIINLPFVLFSLLPLPQRSHKIYQRSLKYLFFLVNLPALFLNLIDVEYFKFTLKRSTADLIDLAGYGEDLSQLIPVFIRDFWYLVLIFIALAWGFWKLYKLTERRQPERESFTMKYLLHHGLVLVVMAPLVFLGARGGLGVKPLNILNAGTFTNTTENFALVLNTPFTMIKTWGESDLEQHEFYDEDELNKHFDPRRFYPESFGRETTPPNVVLIVLESFSADYMGGYNDGEGYTPFIDSLMDHSLVFDRCFANGFKSIEGIPSLTAGTPSLMHSPYISSVYASNRLNSLPLLLAELGYRSSFYHGATNGSMGFDIFCKSAGFDHYKGRTEYANDKDFDGQWGIWDEQFLQYFAKDLEQGSTPFFTTFFSLSSHHPFEVPEEYEGKFPEGDHPMYKAIGYSDHALQKFFETAKEQDWYDNTLFIITADHAGPRIRTYSHTTLGRYHIPLLFFHPNAPLKGRRSYPVQQLDVLPSVLHYVGYKKPFVSFGKSVFERSPDHTLISIHNGVYMITNDEYVLEHNLEEPLHFFRHVDDLSCQKDLMNGDPPKYLKEPHTLAMDRLSERLKAIVQQYNNRMISNRMTEYE